MVQYLSLVGMLKADVVVLSRDSLQVIDSILGSTGGRRPRTVETLDVLEGHNEPPASPVDEPVQQEAAASSVTAAHEPRARRSRGVTAAIEAAADEHNAAEDDDETVGVNVDDAEADVEAPEADDDDPADVDADTDDAEGDVEAPEGTTRG
jgi:hypothetical protein